LRYAGTMITSRYQPPMLTTGERVRNLIWCALALSLLLHALATPIFPNRAAVRDDDSPLPVSIDRPRHPVHVVTPPPPKPQIRRQRPLQRARSERQIPVRVPQVLSPAVPGARTQPVVPYARQGSVATAVPGDADTAPPTEAPACADPNRDAVASNVVSPEYPSSESGIGSVAVLVAVTIDAAGGVSDVRVSQSSGNAAIDQAALRAARASSYRPRLVNCVPSAGTYIFRAEFSPDT
jgi:TonB family protein